MLCIGPHQARRGRRGGYFNNLALWVASARKAQSILAQETFALRPHEQHLAARLDPIAQHWPMLPTEMKGSAGQAHERNGGFRRYDDRMRREQVTIGRKQITYLASETAAPAVRQHPLRTVVFLHAFPLTAEMWEPNLGALPEGWRGIAPDLRGFGHSPLPASDTPQIVDFAGDVVDLLDRLEITSAVLVGCSMGGYVLFEMIHTARQYASGVVLVSTRADADSEEGRAGRRRMLEGLESGGVSAIANEMAPKLLGITTRRERPDLETHLRNLILANKPDAIRTAVTAMMERSDSTPLLAQIKVPTLIVAGAEDMLIPTSQAGEMHRAISKSACEIMASAGHLPSLEQTTPFDRLLCRFLQKL